MISALTMSYWKSERRVIQREVAPGMEHELNDIIEFGSADSFASHIFYDPNRTVPLSFSGSSAAAIKVKLWGS